MALQQPAKGCYRVNKGSITAGGKIVLCSALAPE